jgi:valyl-tRNA synthetase
MDLEKQYDPAKYEADIYKMWEDSGAFQPSDSDKEPFSIILPPPNANGDLHVGHAMYVVEDILTRYHRMLGQPTLWLPGMDHAGIETQVVYERLLEKEGKTRFDLGREQFYQDAYAFTRKNMARMQDQLRSLGFSLDWSRLKFTLDDDILAIVYDTFKRLHADGYIYRGNRIVNWCPYCHSGFADIEIKHRDQIDPLYYIKYGPFVLATVRPETKFGDTAIAVHPKDERYKKYIGQEIEVEGLLGTFKLKVIADSYVNPEFGTGVVKVTPAHDPNDWEMGLRHNLEVKQVIGTDGKLTEIAGRYAGMPAAEARVQVAHDLEERGLMDHIEMDYSHSIAYHDRCGTPIEPLVTEQWWLKVEELKKPAIEAVKSGKIQIVPKRSEKVYIDWLENLRDWNIGRQNWFGIRIPVYYRRNDDATKDEYLIATDEAEARKYYGEGNYEAESDTFDTWFSSSQWPFATLQATGDFDRFYPTSVMDTGRDILFLWITRMVMMGIYATGEVPFQTVYLHGLINDAHGKKMSKSKGNVTNPLEMTEKYGTDALRLALTIGITPGNDGSISEQKIEGYRNFCNKLWNVARFILSQLPEDYSPTTPAPLSLADRWIMDMVSQATKDVTKAINSYRFSDAGAAVYALLWNDFADWYIETSKVESNPDVMVHVLENILKLAHPIAPFVTEAIWQKMAWHKQDLIVSSWPEPGQTDAAARKEFGEIQTLVTGIRALGKDLSLAKPILLHSAPLIAKDADLILQLAGLSEVKETKQGSGLAIPGSSLKAWLDVDAEMIQMYRSKLEAERDNKQAYIAGIDKQLANKQFVASAPDTILQQRRDSKAEAELLLSKLDEQIAAIPE